MALYRHRFSGVCAAGDIWVFSWWSDSSLSTEQANTEAVAWATDFWQGDGTTDGYQSKASANVEMTGVETGEIDMSNGRQLTKAEASVSLPGTATGNALPADVAIVCTLRSIVANRSGRGRFYMPQPAVSTVGSLGRITTAARDGILADLTGAFSGAVTAGLTPVVYSSTYRRTAQINMLGVGDLFDTQRSRENALTENRSTNPMP